jgi:hypothetical protein
VVVGLPEYLRAIGDYRMLVFGAILIATCCSAKGARRALQHWAARGGLAMRLGAKLAAAESSA